MSAEVWIIIPPTPGHDARDWVNAMRDDGRSDEEIYQTMVNHAVRYKPADADETIDSADLVLLEQLKIKVIGASDQVIEVYSHATAKYALIKDIDRLKYARLIQIAGRKAVEQNVSQQSSTDKYSMDVVRNAIASVAAEASHLDDAQKRGTGVWSAPGEIVLVGGRELAVWKDGKLERSSDPVRDGKFYDLSGNSSWYDFGRLSALLSSGDGGSDSEALGASLAILRRWRWDFRQGAELALGLILASWIQKIWLWRPQVVVTGETGSGKSIFLSAAKKLFCGLARKAAVNSTALGISKRCRDTSIIAILDEIDENRYREDIYRLVIRASGRGEDERWTCQDSGSSKSPLSQIFWMGAIESGIFSKTDAHRMVRLELLPRARGSAQIVQPTDPECWNAGQQLLAASLRHAHAASRLAVELGRTEIDGVPNRVCETYGVPAACYALLAGLPGEEVLREFLMNHFDGGEDALSDEEDLIESICDSHVDAGTKLGRLSIRQLIVLMTDKHGHAADQSDARTALEKSGISVDGDFVLARASVLCRYPLRGTRHSAKSISEIFQRIPGAVYRRTKTTRRWAIPLRCFVDFSDGLGDTGDAW